MTYDPNLEEASNSPSESDEDPLKLGMPKLELDDDIGAKRKPVTRSDSAKAEEQKQLDPNATKSQVKVKTVTGNTCHNHQKMDADSANSRQSLQLSMEELKRQEQSRYNKVCESIYFKITDSLGTAPYKLILGKAVVEGDGPGAYEALLEIYANANPRSLPHLFDQLVNYCSIENCGSYPEYSYKFQQILGNIDSNPAMEKFKVRGLDHTLPDPLLVSFFLRGLNQNFSTVIAMIKDDMADPKKAPGINATILRVQAHYDSMDGGYQEAKRNTRNSPRSFYGGTTRENQDRHKGSHFPNPGTPGSSTGNPTKIICRNWKRYGKCRYGSKCKFQHITGQPDQKREGLAAGMAALKINPNGNQNPGYETYLADHKWPSTPAPNPAVPPPTEGTPNATPSSPHTPIPKSYYAVYNGKNGFTGVLRSWHETEPRVKHRNGNFRRGVSCRKFPTLGEAENYLYDRAASSASDSEPSQRAYFAGQASSQYVLDSGTSTHLRGSLDGCTDVRPSGERLMVADGKTTAVDYIATHGSLRDVRVVPGAANLISIGHLCDDGEDILFSKGRAYKGSFRMLRGRAIGYRDHSTGGLYYAYDGATSGETALDAQLAIPNKIQRLHERLFHLSYNKIADAIEAGELSLPGVSPQAVRRYGRKPHACKACGLSKSTRRKHEDHKGKTRCTAPWQRLHVDTCCISNSSRSNKKYFLMVVDEFSRRMWVLLLARRAHAGDEFRRFLNFHRGLNECVKPTIIKTDGAKEFTFGDLAEVREEFGIEAECSAPYDSSGTNPIAERAIRSIVQMARSSIIHAQAPESLWDEALVYATHVYNYIPHPATPGAIAPIRAYYGDRYVPPKFLQHVRTFFSPVFAPIPNRLRGFKFRPVAQLGRFVGVHPRDRGYRILMPNGRITIRRDVYFQEDLQRAHQLLRNSSTPESAEGFYKFLGDPSLPSPPPMPPLPTGDASRGGDPTPAPAEEPLTKVTPKPSPPGTPVTRTLDDARSNRPVRKRKPRLPTNIGGSQHDILNSLGSSNSTFKAYATGATQASRYYTPKNYWDALSCPDAE